MSKVSELIINLVENGEDDSEADNSDVSALDFHNESNCLKAVGERYKELTGVILNVF